MNDRPTTRYLYWLDEGDFERARELLLGEGFRVEAALLTPCQVMRASGDVVRYASPGVWSRLCWRQASWYRESGKQGRYMMMSSKRLPAILDTFLEAQLRESTFRPERLPEAADLEALLASEAYQETKPADWERIGLWDAIVMKVLFRLFGFWKRGENLKRYWTSQRANHANFLARRFTTDIDGEKVPYTVTENAGVCSSCAEFFNVVSPQSRKLVRSCPGAAIFAGAPRDVYLGVRPQRGP